MQTQQLERLRLLGGDGIALSLKELVYYQGKTRLLELAPRHAVQAKLAGNYLAKTKGRGMEFDEVRPYQAGDDIRTIDWRVTARTGNTHTKLFREERERPIFIFTDLGQSMQFGSTLMLKSVQAAHIAALIAWRAKQRGDRLGGLVAHHQGHVEIKPRSRQAGVLHYLHALVQGQKDAQSTQQKADYFADACARLRRLSRPGSAVYIISDFQSLDAQAQQHLTQLSRHCELTAIQVTDPLELNLPQSKQTLAVTDGNQRRWVQLNNARDYQHQAEQTQQSIHAALVKSHVRQLNLTTAHLLEQQLSGQI